MAFSLPLIFLLMMGKAKLEFRDSPHFMLRGLVFSFPIFGSVVNSLWLSSSSNSSPNLHATILHSHNFLSLRKKTSAGKLAIVLIGMFGAFLASGLTPQRAAELDINLGIFLALSGGFFYALYLFLKRTEKSAYTPLQALFNTFLFAASFTLILGSILRFFTENPLLVSFVIPNHYQLTLLVLFAIFSTVLPYGLLNYVNTAEVSPTSEGTILLLDPAFHVIWAILLLEQIVSIFQYVEIILVLMSVFAMLRI